MTTFALVRHAVDHWGLPMLVLIDERPTQDEAESLARECLETWPDLAIEEWTDSFAELQGTGGSCGKKARARER